MNEFNKKTNLEKIIKKINGINSPVHKFQTSISLYNKMVENNLKKTFLPLENMINMQNKFKYNILPSPFVKGGIDTLKNFAENLKGYEDVKNNILNYTTASIARIIEMQQKSLQSSFHKYQEVYLDDIFKNITGLQNNFKLRFDTYEIKDEDAEENEFEESNNEKSQIKEVSDKIIHVEIDLIKEIVSNPNMLYKISPRKFEELIADILVRNKFTVELTKKTRDGGKDIVATLEYLGIKTKYVVECKRFKKTNKVSIGIVQRLYGVKKSENANKGLVVTTSYFTQQAIDFAFKHRLDIELKNYDDIIKWLMDTLNKSFRFV